MFQSQPFAGKAIVTPAPLIPVHLHTSNHEKDLFGVSVGCKRGKSCSSAHLYISDELQKCLSQ